MVKLRFRSTFSCDEDYSNFSLDEDMVHDDRLSGRVPKITQPDTQDINGLLHHQAHEEGTSRSFRGRVIYVIDFHRLQLNNPRRIITMRPLLEKMYKSCMTSTTTNRIGSIIRRFTMAMGECREWGLLRAASKSLTCVILNLCGSGKAVEN